LGLEKLRVFLGRHRVIGLDTNVFIYQLEANPQYLPLTDLIFRTLERSTLRAVTSTITMTGLLVPAYRSLDDQRVDEFYSLLSTYPNLAWIEPGLRIADLAAELRAMHGLKTPDALQIATAIYSGASAFVTNGPIFDRIKQVEILVLDRAR